MPGSVDEKRHEPGRQGRYGCPAESRRCKNEPRQGVACDHREREGVRCRFTNTGQSMANGVEHPGTMAKESSGSGCAGDLYSASAPLPVFSLRELGNREFSLLNAALRRSLLIYRLKDEFDLLAGQQLELGTVNQRLLVFRISAEHPHLEGPVACRPAIKTAGQAACVERHAIDAQRTSLELAPAGLKDVVYGVVLTPVAPKLLRDRADDRLSVGQFPWCRYERCSRDNLHHRLSPSGAVAPTIYVMRRCIDYRPKKRDR